MVLLIALAAAAVIALLLWKAMSAAGPSRDVPGPQRPEAPPSRPGRPPVHGPDDDPEFLRSLEERFRRGTDEPPR